jgi:hypothetical protein
MAITRLGAAEEFDLHDDNLSVVRGRAPLVLWA